MPIKINGTNTAANPSITGDDTDTGIVYGNDQIDFSTGGTSKAAIDASGNLTLGGFSAPTDLNSAQVPTLFVDRVDNNIFGEDGALYISQNAYFNNSGSYERITTQPSTQYKQRLGKHKFTTAAGGTAGANFSFSEKVTIDTDGLKFNGDTSSANALDDYEEGTWTPTFDTNAATNTSGNCTYIKIGHVVHCFFRATHPVTSSSSFATISDLPFTSHNHTVGVPGGAFSETNAGENLHFIVNPNTTFAYILLCDNNGVQVRAQNTISGKDFRGCITYRTT